MNDDSPLGMFITWTVYGTFLPGDGRGWRHRSSGDQLARPLLETWHRDRLNHNVITLDDSMRSVADGQSARYVACDLGRFGQLPFAAIMCMSLSQRPNTNQSWCVIN